jgi:inosine-uridine nucleoside N-ribohydrolase
MKKIIIDTDPGVDDALAIILAIKANLPVDSLVTVFGNSNIKNSTTNAISILELLNSNIEIYQGTDKPLIGKKFQAISHGENGLSGVFIKSNKKVNKNTISHYLKTINENPGEVTLVCMGPTTNIALLLKKEPNILKKIEKIIILGGSFSKGNITEYAEFNVYSDPEALNEILNSGSKNIYFIPIDVCREVVFTFEDIKKKGIKHLELITKAYIEYYSKPGEYSGYKGGVMYDLLTIAYLINIETLTFEKSCIKVNTTQNKRRGQTLLTNQKNNCYLAKKSDHTLIKKIFNKYV